MNSASGQPQHVPEDDLETADLRVLAARALREMLLEGRLGAGDLIRVMGLETEQSRQGQDFVIRLVED